MFGTQDLTLFLLACLLLNITPGQDTLFILGRSIAQGASAGIFSVAGIMSGILIHTTLAALGLSVILTTSVAAFNAIKYAGAAYLIWIGITQLRSRRQVDLSPAEVPRSVDGWVIYRQGLLTNLLNPKVALFFLSFLPQFVAPDTSYHVIPFLLLGSILFTTGTIWCLLLVCCAAWLRRLFYRKSNVSQWIGKLTGVLFITLGIRLALAGRD